MLTTMVMAANLLLINGKVWTGDPDKRFVEAVAIEGNRIVAAGTTTAVLAAGPREAKTIDLGGRLLVPGFIDNHTHFLDGGFQISRVNLRDAASPEEFARRIGEFA